MMKNKVRILTILLLIVPLLIFAQKESKDMMAIKQVIEKETKAFFEIDYNTWQAQWVHAPYSFWSFSDTTDVNFFAGWEEINQGFDQYFKTSKPSEAKIDRNWQAIKIFGNTAIVQFTQKISEEEISRAPQAEVRYLEKTKEGWKIVNVTVIRKSNQ